MLIHANRDELLRLSKQVALAVPETTEIIDLRESIWRRTPGVLC